jgi:outer membrane protease
VTYLSVHFFRGGSGGPIVYPDGSLENAHFPFSQLEWPLDIRLARVDAGINIGSSWRINAIVKKNIKDPDNNMKNSDWITPGSFDVYSESKISDFEALIWDIDVEWVFIKRQAWDIYAGFGYQYQEFEYGAQNIYQYSPSGLPGFAAYGDGSVSITYEMKYIMPYFLLGTDFQINPNFTVAGSFAYSPWVDADDEDYHLARKPVIVSQGDMDGDAYMFDVSGTYRFLPSWFLKAGFHYIKIAVDGNRYQSSGSAPNITVRVESESAQTSGYLSIGYMF